MRKSLFVTFLCLVMMTTACKSAKAPAGDSEVKDTKESTITKSTGKKVPIDFDALGITDYEYPASFELGENMKGAICVAAVDTDVITDAGSDVYKEYFVQKYCQNSYYYNDYLGSLEGDPAFMSKEQVEYMQFSLTGRYVDFSDTVPEEGLDMSQASSGYVTIDMESYEVVEEADDEVTLHMTLNRMDQGNPDNPNTTLDATVVLAKNPKSCFEGYSIRSIEEKEK